MRAVEAPFDVVVTTNSGFPLDQNLYQAVKGMSAAYQVVKPGGLIVCAAECRDGFPDHGSYREVLASAASPRALLDAIRASDKASDNGSRQRQTQRDVPRHRVSLRPAVIRPNATPSDETGMHGKEKVYGSIP